MLANGRRGQGSAREATSPAGSDREKRTGPDGIYARAHKRAPPKPEGLRAADSGEIGQAGGNADPDHTRYEQAQLLPERKNRPPIGTGRPIRADDIRRAWSPKVPAIPLCPRPNAGSRGELAWPASRQQISHLRANTWRTGRSSSSSNIASGAIALCSPWGLSTLVPVRPEAV